MKVIVVTVRHVHSVNVANVIEAFKRRGWKVRVWRFEWFWEWIERVKLKRAGSFDVYRQSINERKESRLYGVFARVVSWFVCADALIVQSDSTALTRVLVKAAKHKHIASLLLLNVSGILGDTYVAPEFVCDEVAVTGEGVRRKLRECGVVKPISVVGQPVYDGIMPARKNVVYATENLPADLSARMFGLFCRAMKEFPEVKVTVKLHPSEKENSLYWKLLRKHRLEGIVESKRDTREVFGNCDLVVSGFSAAILDAVVLGKPVVCINLSGLPNPIPFSLFGVAFEVHDSTELHEKIEGILYGDFGEFLACNRQRFVEAWCGALDGRASSRVVDVVENMTVLKSMEHDGYLISDYERMVSDEAV